MKLRNTTGLARYAKANKGSSSCPPHVYIAGVCLYCAKPKRKRKSGKEE